jgi:hypothetical protein
MYPGTCNVASLKKRAYFFDNDIAKSTQHADNVQSLKKRAPNADNLVDGLKKRASLIKERASFFVRDTGQRQASVTRNRLNELREDGRGLISPNSPIVWKIDLLMVVLLLFTAIVTPYEVCFLEQKEMNALFFINRVVDLGFIADMVIQFFQNI